MHSETRKKYFSHPLILLTILKLSCFFVFLGRAWEHIRWDPPYRAFFWDQKLLEGIVVKFTGLSWMEYASSTVVDNMIQNLTLSIGWFYVLCAIASLVISKNNIWIFRICKWILAAGSAGLIFLAYLYFKEQFLQLGQFLEYASQFGSPIILLLFISGFSKKHLTFFLKIAIALTFICHGLYALGYYPTPGNWVDMVILAFGVPEQSAFDLLYLAGVMDILFALAIFIPGFARIACIYLFVWGFMTAIARVYANLYMDSAWLIMEQHLHEVIYRVPHFLLPFLLFFISGNEKNALMKRLGKLISRDRNSLLKESKL